MNARQRRGLLLVVLAGVLGLGTFVLLASYVSDVRADVGSTVPVYRVVSDVEAFEVVTEDMVERVEVPLRFVAPDVLRDDGFLGRRLGAQLPTGAYITETALLPASELTSGEREIAINVDAETGVAGRLQPGDYVNINVTLEEESQVGSLRVAAVLVRRARIVSFGSTAEAADADGGTNAVVPVTFALSEQDSLRLLYAEAFAQSVRLSKVLPEDTAAPDGSEPYTSADVFTEFQQTGDAADEPEPEPAPVAPPAVPVVPVVPAPVGPA